MAWWQYFLPAETREPTTHNILFGVHVGDVTRLAGTVSHCGWLHAHIGMHANLSKIPICDLGVLTLRAITTQRP